jgi:hypothetical protein
MTPGVHEVWFDDCCLAFDGRVVEVFGGMGSSDRFHLRQFGHEVKGPDRSGAYSLHAGLRNKRGRLSGGVSAIVQAAEWPQVQQLLQLIDAARPPD